MKRYLTHLVPFLLLIAAPIFAQTADRPSRANFVAQAQAELRAAGIDLTGDCGAAKVTQLAVKLANDAGDVQAGVLAKTAGAGCVFNGQLYAKDAIVYPDGQVYDVIVASGAMGGNGTAGWGRDADRTDVACPCPPGLWRRAVDPSVYGFTGTVSPAPTPTPTPSPSVDYQSEISALQSLYNDLKARLDALQAQSDVDHGLLNTAVAEGLADLSNRVQTLEAKPIPGACQVHVFGFVAGNCAFTFPAK